MKGSDLGFIKGIFCSVGFSRFTVERRKNFNWTEPPVTRDNRDMNNLIYYFLLGVVSWSQLPENPVFLIKHMVHFIYFLLVK